MSQPYDDVVGLLRETTKPVVRYKFRRYVDGADTDTAELVALRRRIKQSPIAEGLMKDLAESNPADKHGMSTIYLTFRYLADINYPPGEQGDR